MSKASSKLIKIRTQKIKGFRDFTNDEQSK